MNVVLLVAADEPPLEKAASRFRGVGWVPRCAASGLKGLSLLSADTTAVVVAYTLPDRSVAEIVRETRRRHERSWIVVAKATTCARAVEAMQSGADDCVEASIDSIQVLRRVRVGATNAQSEARPRSPVIADACVRWARVVTQAAESPRDLPTLAHWAHFVGASVGSIRSWCAAANQSPRGSLRFARLLRVVLIGPRSATAQRRLFDAVDPRTVTSLIASAGSAGESLPSRVDEFLVSQCLIGDRAALECLTLHLRERRHTTSSERETCDV